MKPVKSHLGCSIIQFYCVQELQSRDQCWENHRSCITWYLNWANRHICSWLHLQRGGWTYLLGVLTNDSDGLRHIRMAMIVSPVFFHSKGDLIDVSVQHNVNLIYNVLLISSNVIYFSPEIEILGLMGQFSHSLLMLSKYANTFGFIQTYFKMTVEQNLRKQSRCYS